MAGGGGFIVLPTLIAGGLSAPVANGTLRVGILIQNSSALIVFQRRGVQAWRDAVRLGPAIIAGALCGAWLITRVSAPQLKAIFGILLLGWAVVLLVSPGAFFGSDKPARPPSAITDTLTLVVGFYGGMFQAGVGFPLLALLMGHLHYPPSKANMLKFILVLGYTITALPLFVAADQVAWQPGMALGFGMMTGAWIGVRAQIRRGWIVRWVLLAMLIVAGTSMVWR